MLLEAAGARVTALVTRRHATAVTNSSGQAVAVATLFMFVLLGMGALVIDMGSWYQQHRSAQAAADSAALAGAGLLDAGWAQAEGAAQANFIMNRSGSQTIVVSSATAFAGSSLSGGDSLLVTVSSTAPTGFASLFGIGSVHIDATAQATLESYTSQSGHVMPWAIMKDSFTVGNSYAIYTDNSGSNNGTVDLPLDGIQANPACSYPSTSGVSDLTGVIDGAQSVGVLHIGDCLISKPGGSPTPAKQGLSAINPWYTLNSALQLDANGQYTLLHDTAQLAVMPIVTNSDGTTAWTTGTSHLLVVGFAWFFVTGYTNAGKQVQGTFVKLSSVAMTGQSSGAYSSYGTATTVALTQ
jgi:Flp pilus assembly protein TadG